MEIAPCEGHISHVVVVVAVVVVVVVRSCSGSSSSSSSSSSSCCSGSSSGSAVTGLCSYGPYRYGAYILTPYIVIGPA